MNNRIKSKIPLFIVKIYDTMQLAYNFLFKRYKKSGIHDFKEPFFIIGSGRSGNTLLRSMLVKGGDVSIPPESYVWPKIIRLYSTYNFLPWDNICSLIIGEFEAYKEFFTWETSLHKAYIKARNLPNNKRSLSYIIHIVYLTYQQERKEETIIWGDKTPINTIFIDKIQDVFSHGKYIHILRDPKDVVSSYVKANLYSKHQDAAVFWKTAIEKVIILKTKLPENQFHQVQYEDLVRFPEKELRKVCKFLEISYSPEMLEFWKNANTLGDVKYGEHHANLKNPLDETSIGKWKKTLTNEQVKTISKITDELYQKIK